VADNDCVVTRSSGQHTTITNVMLDVTNDCTFRDRSEREDIAYHKIGLLPAENELSGVHPLGGDEELLLVLESERVAEGDPGKRGSTARIVNDFSDYSLEVAIALAEVEAAEPRRTFTVVSVRLED